jgi:type II secretory pathway pseudopilin PulG
MPRRPARHPRDDRGETLIELLVTLVILSTAVIAIVGALATAIKVSDIHRKQANANAYVRAYAEAIETYVASGSAANPTIGYKDCADKTWYQDKYAVPNPAIYEPSIVSMEYWTDAGWQGSCPGTGDVGVQRLLLKVRSKDDAAVETLTVILRKPCRAVDSACA